MCGLVALLTKRSIGISDSEKKTFKQMLYADALRGWDSTGVYGINKYGSVSVLKSATPAPSFITSKSYEDWESEMWNSGRFLVGHNRAATKGKVDDNNAHPFTEGHITLVHNGTLETHKELANVEVDSLAITKAIARDGYKEVLPKIDGAFALIWYDMKLEKLFVTRNSKRPLSLIYTKDKNSCLIASEPEMARWIGRRNGLSLEESLSFNEEDDNDVGTVFSFSLDDMEFKKESVKFFTPKYTHGTYYWPKEEEETKDDKKQTGGSVTPFSHGTHSNTSSGGDTTWKSSKLRNIVSESTPDHTMNDPSFWKNKSVVFKLNDFVSTGTLYTVMGEWKGASITGPVNNEELLDSLFKYDQLIGDAQQVYYYNDKLSKISVNNIQPFLYKFTKNGELIDANRWEKIHKDCYCDECGVEVTIRELEEAVVRFNKHTGLPRRIVCGECIAEYGRKNYEKACN